MQKASTGRSTTRRRRRRPLTSEVIESFITSRRAVRCSTKYESWLRYAFQHLARLFVRLPDRPEEIETALAGCQRQRGSGDLADQTMRDIFDAWGMLYRFAGERFGVTNPMLLIRPPHVTDKEPRTLSDREQSWLLAMHRGKPREYALLLLLLDTGARIGEVAGLEKRDIGDGQVYLSGKTGERHSPISPSTQAALSLIGDGIHVFVGRQGPLTVGGLQKLVRRCLKRAGVSGGPHMLRHTFCVTYIRNGGDSFSLREIVGHRQIQTTERYVRFARRQVREMHGRYSPVARTFGEGGEAAV